MSDACSAAGFCHEALLYRDGVDGFAREIAPMVADTLAGGGSAVVAAPTDRIERLRGLFGDAERLELLDMSEIGINPARIIPAWRDLADEAFEREAPFLGVGEPVWKGRTDDELSECHRHEALINVAFADDPAWRLVCPYDVDGLGPAVLEDVSLTHPAVIAPGGHRHEGSIDPLVAVRATERPLAPIPADADSAAFDRHRLSELRDLVAARAATAGLSRQRIADAVLAATELATNSVRHGGGAGTLSVWDRDGALLCQASDRGLIDDPLVGRRRPDFEHPSGRGMWIVQQICELVQIRSSERGTDVRVTIAA